MAELRASRDQAQSLISKAEQRWWRITLAVTAVLLAALVVTAVIVLNGGESKKTTQGAQSTQSTQSAPAASATVPASPTEDAPAEPGAFGKPSLPGTDPADAWKGAKPIEGIDPAVFKTALTEKWSMSFRTRPLLAGTMEIGLAGDESRKQRRLDAIIQYDGANTVYQVMCQSGGSEIIPTDETSMAFVADCLATTVRGDQWTTLKDWLDTNLLAIAEGVTSTSFQLPSVRMYVESNRHVISCVLTNS